MEKYIYNEKNGLWYELQGDYYLPCLKLPEEGAVHIDIWGNGTDAISKNYARCCIKVFLKEVVLPITLAFCLASFLKPIYMPDGVCDYFPMWICVGLPFGIRRMCLWLVPSGYGISGSVGIFVLNLIIPIPPSSAGNLCLGAGASQAPPQAHEKRHRQPLLGPTLLCRLRGEAVLQCHRQLQAGAGVFLLLLLP